MHAHRDCRRRRAEALLRRKAPPKSDSCTRGNPRLSLQTVAGRAFAMSLLQVSVIGTCSCSSIARASVAWSPVALRAGERFGMPGADGGCFSRPPQQWMHSRVR